MPSAPGDVVGGVGLVTRSASFLLRRPRLFWLGAVPPAITSVVFVALLVLLVGNLTALTTLLTPFADGWSAGLTLTARVVVGALLVGGAVLLMVLVFTTLTLALGLLWGLMMLALVLQLPTPQRWIAWVSLFFPMYYTVLSLILHARR